MLRGNFVNGDSFVIWEKSMNGVHLLKVRRAHFMEGSNRLWRNWQWWKYRSNWSWHKRRWLGSFIEMNCIGGVYCIRRKRKLSFQIDRGNSMWKRPNSSGEKTFIM